MTTSMYGPDPVDVAIMRGEATHQFLDGDCYSFAEAMHEAFGWPMVGLFDADIIRHALVEVPDGRYLDVRGYVERKDAGEPFCFCKPYEVRYVTSADLVREDESIERRMYVRKKARQYAEFLWPDLPWNGRNIDRVRQFVDELEALSRRYDFWIRPQTLTTLPIITSGCGDEQGYDVYPLIGGKEFTFNRRLAGGN